MLPQLPRSPSISMQHFRSCRVYILPTQQLVHRRTGGVHGIKNNEVTEAIPTSLEADDGDGVTGLLEVYGWKKSLVDVRAVLNSGLGEVAFNGVEKGDVSFDPILLVVAELLDCAVNLGAQEECLCLFQVSGCRDVKIRELTSGVPMYFLVSRMPPVCVRPIVLMPLSQALSIRSCSFRIPGVRPGNSSWP